MSRLIIGGAVVALVVVLTALAYFVASSNIEDGINSDVRARVSKATELLGTEQLLERIRVRTEVEKLAKQIKANEAVIEGLRTGKTKSIRNAADAVIAQSPLLGKAGKRADFVALLNKEQELVVQYYQDHQTPAPNPKPWHVDGKIKYPALALALRAENPLAMSDIWMHENLGLMKMEVTPLVMSPDGSKRENVGALVVGHELGVARAARLRQKLGAHVAFFADDQIQRASFRKGRKADTAKIDAFRKASRSDGLISKTVEAKRGVVPAVELTIDGERFIAGGVRFDPIPGGGWPDDYRRRGTSGGIVLISLTKKLAPVSTVKSTILLLGIGALVIALLALFVTSRHVTHQADKLEVGVHEIINGNLDKVFAPVGKELDGLANALNVMLARLLGRPEPGEEEFDEDGNLVQGGRLSFDTDLSSSGDSEAVALAQEPEPDYYKRVYSEYIEARQQVGESVDGLGFDSFVTKLRVNEGSLRSKYQCSAIRFKVLLKDGKVTLKPVPIV